MVADNVFKFYNGVKDYFQLLEYPNTHEAGAIWSES